jgi:MFS family permease
VHICHNRHRHTDRVCESWDVPRWPRYSRICCWVSLETQVDLPSVDKDTSGLVATVPIYLSEISPPHHRGLIGGISGCGISFGTMMSNWVGFACGYAPFGATQWRLPLALQTPWGVILFVGLATFMPNSPRQLIRNGKVDQARIEFLRIHRDLQDTEAHEEFALMRNQIQFEMQRELTSYKEIFKLFRRRAFV